jgi:AcrR family transcriptional regulator
VTEEQLPVDGRSARRARNRNAVLDAVHELFTEIRAFPSLESVAARSGVSLRSIHRYFPDSQGLMLEAVARRVGVTAALYELRDLGEGSVEERINRLVEQRLTIYEEASATIRVALAVQDSMPRIAEQVGLREAHLLAQLEKQFAPELEALDPRSASSVVACADILMHFEGVDRLHRAQGLPLEEVRRILVDGLSRLLATASTG